MQIEDMASGDELTPRNRIALAYAPRRARGPWAALLLLEQRLADAARPGREPLMVQLRLAWWRDRLGEDAARWPVSEPVLAHLRTWQGQHQSLAALVNGWEALIVSDDGGQELAHARAEAYVALANLLCAGKFEAIRAAAAQLDDPHQAPLAHALPRAMRPLAVLCALARRDARGGEPKPFADLARIVRAGLLGR
ncbi:MULTISPECIES: hypothetical protein [unclassified Novosphingobium]|uniref:hypothetical protein n=1 Tax=unclassified Novosphingobium TaxID=2644732 RepID=UPI000BD7246B|nr:MULTISPECIES: hypothetical protein [unclassified Novosphingobium]OYW49544.1 MAG: hypothetical protein B7Z34_07555 [Novosphingobium sp. 12-62-10]HQS70247.1 hypothetical protein [Novosphingobium sp.]